MAKLQDKIRNVLQESRTLIPGAQVLLGSQYHSAFQARFEALSLSSKFLLLAALSLTLIVLALLIAPAPYHRIVEEGEDTERFHRFASRVLLASLITLALGITGDFFVVVQFATDSTPLALTLSLFMLLFFYGLWFGWTIYRRNRRKAHRKEKPIWAA